MVLHWLARVLLRFSWKNRTFGRGRRRTTWRKWVPWTDFDRLLVARLQFYELEDRLAPAIFTVTNTDDSGIGSLRQAILDANASVGADDIQFAVGTGAISIAPLSALPAISEAVNIDATTQPGWINAPIVELRGDSAGTANDFTITASGSTIKGFVINRFIGSFPNSGHGILITGAVATGNQVAGNYIGTNAAGGAAAPNSIYGVYIGAGASNNIIGTNGDGTVNASERNVISGNAGHGVRIVDAGTDGNVVAGNYIGITADGTSILANGGVGVFVRSSATNTRIGTDGNGVADTDERNVISGNFFAGVSIFDLGTNDTVIAGNYLGTNASGTLSIGGNTGSGVYIRDSQFTRVGTNADGIADTAERNIISGDPYGVTLAVNTSFNVVAGNYIGTDVTGLAAVAGSGAGVTIGAGATDNLIGGNSVAARNVIGGNTKDGVLITGTGTTGNTVAGNYIGTNAAATAATS